MKAKYVQLPEMMHAVRQHEAGGKLMIESIPVPKPGPGEVLVKMAAAPINPSDLALLQGNYLARNYPFIPGLEGSGVVIRSGGGLLSRLRVRKRVACSPNPEGDGTWAQYMKTSVMRTVPLPSGVGSEQGAMMLVNPMTTMAFIQIALKGGHKAMVNNAAASALGKMLIRLTNQHRIPLINIVRKKEQVPELKSEGATYVLNSRDESFANDLQKLSVDLGATLFLDAVTGKQTSILLKAAPRGSTLLAYARLSGDPISVDPGILIKEDKQIEGFQLGNWLHTKSILYKLRFIRRVKKQLSASLTSHINRSMSLEEVEEAISIYRENMSAGKIILLPEKSSIKDLSD
ncbi:MAG: zinc-binding dehydrogenase [Bacteroidales bacterium]|nr:zinc-binding dehydrogenase [Bacteroidales bacterium]